MPNYKIPAQSTEFKEVIRNSQFITRVHCVDTPEKAKAFIKQMKLSYSDATHHCWAYIIGDPQATTLIGCSDDGEPSGTAGKPMSNVLQYAAIGDLVAVCIRYYGGTKLGTGGLTRAYAGGIKQALESLPLKQKIDYRQLNFNLDYSQLKDCEHLLKNYQTENLQLSYQTQINLCVAIASEDLKAFKTAMQNKFKGQIEWKTIY